MINIIQENLIQMIGQVSIQSLAHGCNCFNKMGAGFALQLARRVPDVMGADLATSPGDMKKLGTFSTCIAEGIKFYNLYTQFFYGRTESHFDYMAFRTSLQTAIEDAKSQGLTSMHMPMIGAGLAQGDWQRILECIQTVDQMICQDTFTINIVEYVNG